MTSLPEYASPVSYTHLELEGVLSSNQSTDEERDAAELELKDWHTFGHLSGMGLEQTRALSLIHI